MKISTRVTKPLLPAGTQLPGYHGIFHVYTEPSRSAFDHCLINFEYKYLSVYLHLNTIAEMYGKEG